MSVRVLHGDMLAVLPTLEAESISAVVTDPPYHLASIVKRFGKEGSAPAQHGTDGAFARASKGFMGQTWDGGDIAFRPETWAAVLRVMKPGAHLAAFGASRNYHRMACAIEDAGFEIRDSLMWLYGSGFPKSHDISKAIDKAAGVVRDVTRAGVKQTAGYGDDWDTNTSADRERRDNPATPEAAQWAGWGSALKPAYEPIILARKPLSGTLAANTLKHGVGGINIDACRVESGPGDNPVKWDTPRGGIWSTDSTATGSLIENAAGRWPANLCHDGSPEVMAAFAAFGDHPDGGGKDNRGSTHKLFAHDTPRKAVRNDIHTGYGNATGSAARFFFCGKADAEDRAGSKHPTVKPLSLMTWLVRLICPPGGTVLDPFAGSGTTLLAADRLQLDAIGIEQSAEYVADIHHRLRSDAPLFADAAQ